MDHHCIFCRVVIDEDVDVSTGLCPVCGTALKDTVSGTVSTAPVLKRKLFDRFVLNEWKGEGHFGIVWSAFDTRLDREVALKIQKRFVSDKSQQKLFLREARAAAKLNHPGFATVFDTSPDTAACAYIVTELLPGPTLQEWLKTHTVSYFQAAKFIEEIATAIDHAHTGPIPIAHRDLKPGNIMFDGNGRLKIVDFGLAWRFSDPDATGFNGACGTFPYMAPEQVVGDRKKVDFRVDIYALGVMLYEMLTGTRPFDHRHPNFLNLLKNEPPRPPRSLRDEIPMELERICLQALAKVPDDRPATAGEMARQLRQWISSFDGAVDKVDPCESTIAVKGLDGNSSGRQSTDPLPTPHPTGWKDSDPLVPSDPPEPKPLLQRRRTSIIVASIVVPMLFFMWRPPGQNRPVNRPNNPNFAWPNDQQPGAGPENSVPPGPKNPGQNQPGNQPPQDDAQPACVKIRLHTKPEGAEIVFWGLDPIYKSPDPKQRHAANSLSPVTMELPPGDYLVVAKLDDGRFHEVFRRVPTSSQNLPDIFYHHFFSAKMDPKTKKLKYFELKEITIPELTISENMAKFDGSAKFLMGDPNGKDTSIPKHARRVSSFFLDTREMTKSDYKAITQPSELTMGWETDQFRALDAEEPVQGIPWNDAVMAAEMRGKRLPTEAEYEFAATLGGTRKFPWGDDTNGIPAWKFGPISGRLHDTLPSTPPVLGLFSGVPEWTSTFSNFAPAFLERPQRPQNPSEECYIVRGGPYDSSQNRVPIRKTWESTGPRMRFSEHMLRTGHTIGIRFARSAKPRLTADLLEENCE